MDQPNLLEVRHFNLAYKGVSALTDLSLAVHPAEIHAVLGENGAGKTTLLKLLGGLRPGGDYSGDILFDGRPFDLTTPRAAIRQGVSIVMRRLSVFPALNVTENILIGHMPTNRFMTDYNAARVQADESLKRLGVTLSLESKVSELTDAQQRAVMLARAVSTHPRLLVLDEPAVSAPGAGEMGQLIRILRSLAGQGMATLYLTHSVSEAMDVADRISVLRDGTIVETEDRIDFDRTRLVLAMQSHHPERVAGPEEEGNQGGLFGSLRSLFGSPGSRS
jgi:putative multiple sugar transport system ATP-binding protein